MNGVYLYFVNRHLYSWALLGLLTKKECSESAALSLPTCSLCFQRQIAVYCANLFCHMQMLQVQLSQKTCFRASYLRCTCAVDARFKRKIWRILSGCEYILTSINR